MITMPVAGNGSSIAIKILGYENAAALNDSDANWLRSRIQVAVGPFFGEFGAMLTTQDFAYFESALKKMLDTLQGKAIFETDEEWLRLEIVMGLRGIATVSGVAMANDHSRASLRFSFETDQSYLAQTKRALAQVAENFPVKQQRGL